MPFLSGLRHACALGIVLSMSCGEQVVVRETEASCGNGQVEAGEACDDGNMVNTDGCTIACTLATCGDGTVCPELEILGDFLYLLLKLLLALFSKNLLTALAGTVKPSKNFKFLQ